MSGVGIDVDEIAFLRKLGERLHLSKAFPMPLAIVWVLFARVMLRSDGERDVKKLAFGRK